MQLHNIQNNQPGEKTQGDSSLYYLQTYKKKDEQSIKTSSRN